MALWPIVAALLMIGVIVVVVGFRKNSGVLMVAAGSWALFFVGCGFGVNFDREFILFGFPLIGAFGVTALVLGLRAMFR